jgi:hypothetical protein
MPPDQVNAAPDIHLVSGIPRPDHGSGSSIMITGRMK